MIRLVLLVLQKVSEIDSDRTMVYFFRLVENEFFPLKNCAFHLWNDVVSFYSKENTSCMRYSNEFKQLWKLGWRSFGGKFLHFMGGYKHVSRFLRVGNSRLLIYPSKPRVIFAAPVVLGESTS